MEWKIAVSIIIGYLLGSINTSIIVGKLMYGKDVRKHGSGNAGMTNALRTFGKTAAIIVVLGDILKGVIACIIGYYLVGEVGSQGAIGLYFGGIASVFGHNWPVFFGFKGGKGVMTTFAVVLVISPNIALICLGLFIVIVSLTKYVSLGSIIGALAFPIITVLYGKPVLMTVSSAILAILIISRHHENIGRLLKGNEKKISFGK